MKREELRIALLEYFYSIGYRYIARNGFDELLICRNIPPGYETYDDENKEGYDCYDSLNCLDELFSDAEWENNLIDIDKAIGIR